jgi:hypothetical protein
VPQCHASRDSCPWGLHHEEPAGKPIGALDPLAPGGLAQEAVRVLGVTLCMSGAVAAGCSDSPRQEGGREGGAAMWARVSWLLAQQQDAGLRKGPCERRKTGAPRQPKGVALVLRGLGWKLLPSLSLAGSSWQKVFVKCQFSGSV